MTEAEQSVVDEVVARLSKSFSIRRIILFGSRARGEASENSDYDFLVVITQRRARSAMEVRKVAHIPGVPMDFLVRSPEEWDEGFLLKKEIVAEGKVVYEAADKGMDQQSPHESAFSQGTL